jgi:hypothetical protein
MAVCAALVVVTGAFATMVLLSLNSWHHQTIADQQAEIESLEATERDQSPKLRDLGAQHAKAVGVRQELDQVEYDAANCRAAVAAWRAATPATAEDALSEIFVKCEVKL